MSRVGTQLALSENREAIKINMCQSLSLTLSTGTQPGMSPAAHAAEIQVFVDNYVSLLDMQLFSVPHLADGRRPSNLVPLTSTVQVYSLSKSLFLSLNCSLSLSCSLSISRTRYYDALYSLSFLSLSRPHTYGYSIGVLCMCVCALACVYVCKCLRGQMRAQEAHEYQARISVSLDFPAPLIVSATSMVGVL